MIKKHLKEISLLSLIILVFGNILLNQFVFDDEHFVQKNTYLQSAKFLPQLLTQNIIAGSGFVSNLYRPLQSLTHFIDVQIWGMNPFGHHLSNLLYFIIMAFALFYLLKKYFPINIAWCGTLIFCLHPMQSEAVAYISGRGDILANLFLFLSLLFLNTQYILVAGFSLLAMMSKESMAFIPLYLFIFNFMLKENIALKKYLPTTLVSVFYIISRLTWLNFQNTLNFYSSPNIFTENFIYRLYTYFSTIPKIFGLWFLPYDLHHERSWSVYVSATSLLVLAGFFMLVSLLTLSFYQIKKNKSSYLFASLAWFLVASFPTSNLVVLINALFYDHWFILPGFLFLWTLIFYLQKFPKILYAIIAIFILITPYYNAVWKNPFTLYQHILKYEPNSAKAHNNLAMAYSDRGDFKAASSHYKKAILINDTFAESHHNLANLYLQEERYKDTLEELNLALKINPNFAPSLNLKAKILEKFPELQSN